LHLGFLWTMLTQISHGFPQPFQVNEPSVRLHDCSFQILFLSFMIASAGWLILYNVCSWNTIIKEPNIFSLEEFTLWIKCLLVSLCHCVCWNVVQQTLIPYHVADNL
jgi:hypothetical protein